MNEYIEAEIEKVFGIGELYQYQKDVIACLLSGRDALVNRSVGSGKSLCFQAPAVVGDGLVVVVSPLIALMNNQISQLGERGIRAMTINSTQGKDEQKCRLDALASPEVRLFYVSPESLTSSRILSALRERKISLVAVDEAHCVSQWGHDFRPAYLKIAQCVEAMGRPPVGAFTATATPLVNKDIAERLGLREFHMDKGPITRENLELVVQKHISEPGKMKSLLELLSEDRMASTIVYCSTRKAVVRVYDRLKRQGIDCAYYHGGLMRELHAESADDFLGGKKQVIVATNAFGMGINKPDIRRIIHFEIPGSIEQYYQEAGRAGRDGQSSKCIMLYADRDFSVHNYFINSGNPPVEFTMRVYNFLKSRTVPQGKCTRFDLLERFRQGKQPELRQAQCLAALTTLAGLGYVSMDGNEYYALNGNGSVELDVQSASDEKRVYAESKLTMMRILAEAEEPKPALIERYFSEGKLER